MHPRTPRTVALAALAIAGALAPFATSTLLAQPPQYDGAMVIGEVYDSLTANTLARAVVQLVSLQDTAPFARAVVASAEGRYSITGVPDGRYALGFFGSVLDSLGFDPPVRSVTVRGETVVQADLGVPSAQTLRALVCPNAAGRETQGLAIGRVRDAGGTAAVPAATVSGSWFEFNVAVDGISRGLRVRSAQSQPNGWYALCDIPVGGELLLSAGRSADSTDLIPTAVDALGVLRRDLYVGRAVVQATSQRPATPDSASSTAITAPTLRAGTGRLRGRVRTAIGDQPLAAAQAGIVHTTPSIGDTRGAFTLLNVPTGTRLLEARAVGYFPRRVAVDVIDSAAPVTVTLQSIKSVLDSVRIVAERDRSANMLGFEQRRATEPVGLFLTQEDIRQRASNFTAEIIANLRGIQVVRDSDGRSSLGMRQALSENTCQPSIFIDTVEMTIGNIPLVFDDLNGFVQKESIRGIEVYPAGNVPPQFQRFATVGPAGCGAIILWTR